MLKRNNSQRASSQDLPQKFIKAVVLVALVVSSLGIYGCIAKLKSPKKQTAERDVPLTQELTIAVNGADLYCKVIGEGRSILFIHGGPGLVHNYFLPYMESLLPYGYRLIFYDQRGNGRSTAYNMDSIKLNVFVQDIESIREKLGVDKLVLFGHSFGGYLAYLYALKYPQHVDAIIGCDVGPLTDKGYEEYGTNWDKQMEQIDIKAIREMPGMTEAAKGIDDEFLKITANRFYDKTKVADFIVNSRTEFMNIAKGQEVQNILFREMEKSFLNQPEYRKPKVYSLLIHGAEDPIPLWTCEQWVNIFDARLEVIGKSNHFPFVEKTDEVSGLIDEFLRAKRVNN